MLAVIATAFGLGYSPIAPGTAGTLPAVGIYLLIALTARPGLHAWLLGGALLAACAGTVALGGWAERYWKTRDPGRFVLDEVAGFLLTVLLFRTGNVALTAAWAFVVTRGMDIVKPPPARQCERLAGGWGILLDDLAASLYAAGLLHLIAWGFPRAVGA